MDHAFIIFGFGFHAFAIFDLGFMRSFFRFASPSLLCYTNLYSEVDKN